MKRLLTLLGVLSALAIGNAAYAEAYIFANGLRTRWQVIDDPGNPGNAQSITYRINTSAEPFGGASNSAQTGIEYWNAVTGSTFVYEFAGNTALEGFNFDTNNTVSWGDPDGDLGNGVLAAAIPYSITDTHSWDNETFHTIAEFDIVFNNGINFAADPPAGGQFSVEGVVLHEAGHALGLDHPDQAGQSVTAVMNSSIAPGDSITGPENDDIAGVAVHPVLGQNDNNPTYDGLYRNTIPNLYPGFSVSQTQGYAPLGLIFTNESVGGSTYDWDFGDGGTSTSQNPTYTYNNAGNYAVVLTLDGTTSSTPQAIFVAVPPNIDFTADTTSGKRPLTVAFTDLTTGNNITAYSWDFGDGQTSTEQNPTHEYLDDGSYTVTLTVNGEAGPISGSKDNYINVGGGQGEEKKGPFAEFLNDLGCNCAVSTGGTPSRAPWAPMALVLMLALGAVAFRRRT